MAHLLDSRRELEGCLAIDTGVSIDGWLDFVKEETAHQGWLLKIIRTPESYEDLVRLYGFPGPKLHRVMWSALKERALRIFAKEHPSAVLASGVRKHESAKRFRSVKAGGTFAGLQVVQPIADWRTPKVWAYLEAHGGRRAPAYEHLGISGDCGCGANSTRTERIALPSAAPVFARRIGDLEAELSSIPKHAGKKRARWGWGPGLDFRTRQTNLLGCETCTVVAA